MSPPKLVRKNINFSYKEGDTYVKPVVLEKRLAGEE